MGKKENKGVLLTQQNIKTCTLQKDEVYSYTWDTSFFGFGLFV